MHPLPKLHFRELRNTRVFVAFGKHGCNFGAIWGLEISGRSKNTHGAQGIRVFRAGLDFAKCEFGGFEIWVPQKYARRSRNTHVSTRARGG